MQKGNPMLAAVYTMNDGTRPVVFLFISKPEADKLKTQASNLSSKKVANWLYTMSQFLTDIIHFRDFSGRKENVFLSNQMKVSTSRQHLRTAESECNKAMLNEIPTKSIVRDAISALKCI